MWDDVLREAADLAAAEEPYVLATVVAYKSPQSGKPGAHALLRPDGTSSGWVGGGCVQPILQEEARQALADGKPRLVSVSPDRLPAGWQGLSEHQMACSGGGSLQIFLEPMLPRPVLLVLGRSQVARTLAQLGEVMGFKVHDDVATVNSRTYVVVATQGDDDEGALESVAGMDVPYLGLVAGKKKAAALFEYLRSKGVAEASIGKVKNPAGLFAGIRPQDVALSILAEIVQLRAQPQVPPPPPATARDLVCHMDVLIDTARFTLAHEGKVYYFCNPRCRVSFEKNPAQYLSGDMDGWSEPHPGRPMASP